MGKLKETLLGKSAGSESSSKSGNYAYDPISSAYKPALNYVTGAGNMMSNMLGLGGGAAQTGALENFANSGGMKFLQEQGMKGITSSKAASGLLNSGSYGTALAKYNQGLASTYLNQYMQNLQGLGGLGINAGQVMAGAGNWSKSSGEQSGGKPGALPMALQAAAAIPGISDRRLKSDIVKIGEAKDGLGIYEYTIGNKRKIGVMADEVKELRPHAHIPNLYLGFDGVDYNNLGSLD
jgi:hypothetical protein